MNKKNVLRCTGGGYGDWRGGEGADGQGVELGETGSGCGLTRGLLCGRWRLVVLKEEYLTLSVTFMGRWEGLRYNARVASGRDIQDEYKLIGDSDSRAYLAQLGSGSVRSRWGGFTEERLVMIEGVSGMTVVIDGEGTGRTRIEMQVVNARDGGGASWGESRIYSRVEDMLEVGVVVEYGEEMDIVMDGFIGDIFVMRKSCSDSIDRSVLGSELAGQTVDGDLNLGTGEVNDGLDRREWMGAYSFVRSSVGANVGEDVGVGRWGIKVEGIGEGYGVLKGLSKYMVDLFGTVHLAIKPIEKLNQNPIQRAVTELVHLSLPHHLLLISPISVDYGLWLGNDGVIFFEK
ncbi:hypothetical protein Tco_1417551 [Tanacetum coccineum]